MHYIYYQHNEVCSYKENKYVCVTVLSQRSLKTRQILRQLSLTKKNTLFPKTQSYPGGRGLRPRTPAHLPCSSEGNAFWTLIRRAGTSCQHAGLAALPERVPLSHFRPEGTRAIAAPGERPSALGLPARARPFAKTGTLASSHTSLFLTACSSANSARSCHPKAPNK
jgi:hypothetical protein